MSQVPEGTPPAVNPPAPATTTTTPLTTPVTPTPPAITPTATEPAASTFDFSKIGTSLQGALDQFFGFLKGPMDGPKLFIILGLGLFLLTLFWGKGKVGGMPSGMVSIVGLLLLTYGAMQKYGLLGGGGGAATSG